MKLASILAVALLSVSVNAAAMSLSGPATTWLVQSYPQGVVLWYTGSVCASGQLVLDANDTADRNKLLAAMVLAAKASGSKMEINYDLINNNTACVISSFGVSGP